MQLQQSETQQEEWLKILTNGLITIPKTWRDKIGIKSGDIAKAQLIGHRIIIEPRQSDSRPPRIYSDKQIAQWLEDDKLPPELAKEADAIWFDAP